MQTKLKEGLVSELKPIREGMKNLSQAITFPKFPSITAYDDDGVEEEDAVIGDIVEQYLQNVASSPITSPFFILPAITDLGRTFRFALNVPMI